MTAAQPPTGMASDADILQVGAPTTIAARANIMVGLVVMLATYAARLKTTTTPFGMKCMPIGTPTIAADPTKSRH